MARLDPSQELCQSQLPKIAEKLAPSAEKDVADRLVYKLVRVEEDGTVVPATEDEVIRMESFLGGDTGTQTTKLEANLLGQELIGCEGEESYGSKDKSSVGSQHLDGLEAERKKLLAQLEFLDVILQKLKDEEQQRLSSEELGGMACCAELGEGSGEHVSQRMSTYFDLDYKWEYKPDTNILSSDISDDPRQKFSLSRDQTNRTKASLGELESPLSTSKHSWITAANESSVKNNATQRSLSDDRKGPSTGWDCDLLTGNVCLDNLSIRELHEAFRTTFGRQTSVKDKQWLKRRISMGLRSCHDVANSNVVLEGEAPSANVEDAHAWVRPCSNSPAEQPLQGSGVAQVAGNRTCEGVSLHHTEPKFLDHKKRLHRGLQQSTITAADRNPENIEDKDKFLLTGDMQGKRQRKPTKRYIEELAVPDTREMIGRSMAKDSDQENFTMESVDKGHLDEQDEQTGSVRTMVYGMKFTTGYRGHRGRPKKYGNMALNCKSAGRAAQLVRKAISVQASRMAAKSTASQSRFKRKPPSDNKTEACVNGPKSASSSPSALVLSVEPLSVLPALDPSDANVEIVPTPKGGMRRKHHRPWALREVMKLVDGVAECGVGKWAEIKKLAFSNSVYRTSVDLKDKWRNLLRASDTHLQAIRQGEHRRKHASAPIPGPILVRVRELAAEQAQPLSLNFDSGISRSGRTVHKRHFS